MIGRTDPGGHSHWKGVWGCAAVMTPFFQASRCSLAHQFTINAPLLCPLFSIFRNFLHFQPCFGQNLSSLDPNFSKFSFPRPHFLKENPLPRPYILKPAWHTPTKKKLTAPPGLIFVHCCQIVGKYMCDYKTAQLKCWWACRDALWLTHPFSIERPAQVCTIWSWQWHVKRQCDHTVIVGMWWYISFALILCCFDRVPMHVDVTASLKL